MFKLSKLFTAYGRFSREAGMQDEPYSGRRGGGDDTLNDALILLKFAYHCTL